MKNNLKENKELDIVVLLEKIKLLFLGILLQFFRKSKLFLSAWKQLSVIIIFGVVAGYFLNDKENDSTKEASALIKINFDAGNYVYNTIDLINQKINSEDTDFFSNDLKLNSDEKIDEVSITPVIDIKDIMVNDINANEIRALFENLEYEDGFSVSEGFKPDYDYHNLKISVSGNSSIETINKIIEFINNNPMFIELRERNLQRVTTILYNNEETIKQIDKLLENITLSALPNTTVPTNDEIQWHGSKSAATAFKLESSGLYIDNKDFKPTELIKTKITLQNENQELKKERLTAKDTVMIVNNSNVLITDNSLFSNKMVYYPILFFFIYLIVFSLVSLYSYLEKLDRAS
tara:strand:+ start:1413 stop:2459 length:1047 start_codon:yes stop_codon:yes gene_type:complete